MTERTYGWNLEMQILVARSGARILELPVPHRRRSGGSSKVSGTFVGTFGAATKILWLLARAAYMHRARFKSPARSTSIRSRVPQ